LSKIKGTTALLYPGLRKVINEIYTHSPDEVVNLLNNMMRLNALQKSIDYVTQLWRG
jgi:hypothetical protein